MVLDTLFSQRLRPISIVSLVILAAGLIGQLITTAVWWSRLHPWFSYGRGFYRIVYNNLFACWILSLIALILLVFFVAIDIFAKSLFEKLTSPLGGTVGVITAIGLFSLAGLIPGAYASSFALDRYHYKKSDGPYEGPLVQLKQNLHLCYQYVGTFSEVFMGQIYTQLISLSQKELADFEKWGEKISKNAYDSKTGLLSAYMCETVGVPTIIFTMLTGLAIILFFYIIVISAYRSPEDKSEGEA